MFRRTPLPPDPALEQALRNDLHRLADHAPATVRYPEEIVITEVISHEFDSPRAPMRAPRRAVGIAASLAAVAGAVGIGAFAISGANEGGGATPADAVALFVEAMNDEDVLGVLDTVDPAEVGALRGAIETTAAEAQRIELLDNSFSLSGVGGVDIEITGLTTATNEIASDLAVVTTSSGSLSLTFDPAAFGFGVVGREAAADATMETATDDTLDDMLLATVRRDGRWYVSVAFTVAEAARKAEGVDYPSEPQVTPEGFDSPEAAVAAMYARLLARDLRGAIATAAPGEGDALQRYAPLFLPELERGFNDFASQGYDLGFTSTTLQVDGDGDRRTVTIPEFVIEGTWPREDEMLMYLDPTQETLVNVYVERDGAVIEGWLLLPAGEPLPASVDDVDLSTLKGWDDPYPFGPVNSTYTTPDGTIAPIPEMPADPTAPLAVRIERTGGCTVFNRDASSVFGVWELSEDGSSTNCVRNLSGLAALYLATSGLTELPAISTVEIDGRWYVSPIGTLLAGVTEALRSVDTGQSLIDSPIGVILYGVERAELVARYTGMSADSIPAECDGVLTVVDGVVTVADDPTIAGTRACANAWFSSAPRFGSVVGLEAGGASDVVVATPVDEPASASTVPTEVTTESIVP
jgi:hypothetical protein